MATTGGDIAPSRMTRRVVTGHDADGKSIIVSDGPCPANLAITEEAVLNDAWRCEQLPADNLAPEPNLTPVELDPTPNGNVLRIVRLPPDSSYVGELDNKELFATMGESGKAALAAEEDSPHPMMHRTASVDYIVIISGEIYAVMERGETLLRPGDILIQRGTNHAWSNRGTETCVMVAVLNAAHPIPKR